MLGFFLVVCLTILLMFFMNISFATASYFGEVTVPFNIGGWWCNADGVWQNGSNTNDIVTNNCSKYASENYGACCPGYKECLSNGTCSGWAKYCYQYTTENGCNTGGFKITSMNSHTCWQTVSEGNCFKTYGCSCKWNSTSNSSNKCMDVLSVITDQDQGKAEKCENGTSTCIWSTDILENNCNNSLNYIKVSKTAIWSGPGTFEGCTNMTRQDTCPITTKLPFFGSFMMFISTLLIIVVYFFKDIRGNKKVLCP